MTLIIPLHSFSDIRFQSKSEMFQMFLTTWQCEKTYCLFYLIPLLLKTILIESMKVHQFFFGTMKGHISIRRSLISITILRMRIQIVNIKRNYVYRKDMGPILTKSPTYMHQASQMTMVGQDWMNMAISSVNGIPADIAPFEDSKLENYSL
jgi:hypothetical protein